jgi:cyclophilin family peptidyl-prolyl cis-trans isomerase
MRPCIQWLAVLLTIGLGTWAWAADEKAPADPPATEAAKPAAPAAGSKMDEFNRVFQEWKNLLIKLRELREKFIAATPAQQTGIQKEFGELIAKGDQLQVEVIKAAEAAYQESSDNKDLADLLEATAFWRAKQDDYEGALTLGELMLSKSKKEPVLYATTGVGAFCTGDLDKAEQYFQKASDAKAMTTEAQQWQSVLGYYKPLWAKEKEIREAEAKADDLPRVLLSTTKGDIELELFENEAPNTVANFISLVEKGFYKDVAFHRVLPNFMAQGGDPKGDGTGGPGYTIPDECKTPNHRIHFRGSLSMAKTAAPDSGGSQFFLCFVPTQQLDGKHTVFGRVVKGMEVLAKLQRRDPQDEKQQAIKPDKIVEAKVLRKRSHEYEVKKSAEKPE